MYHIAICIPTYKRPLMLQKLLQSIAALKVKEDLIKKISIVVVDNDISQTAKDTILEFRSTEETYQVHYHCNPVKGLVNVRNELIDQALQINPDFLAFVDDDQFVSKEWLTEMLILLDKNNSNLAVGPVIPVFEEKVPNWIKCWFGSHHIDDNTVINFLWTGNLTIRANYLQENSDLRFDERFNTTGAEDSYFGVQVLNKGTKIRWAAKAKTFETIPAQRANLRWLIKRAFRGANSYTFIVLLEKQYFKIFKKILASFVYLMLGFVALTLTPIHFKYRYYGILKLAESAGGFAGLLNVRYHEYAKGR